MRSSLFSTIMLIVFIGPHYISAYGFDGGAQCNPKTSRRGRNQILETIPCDLTVQAYCNLPGSLYPWHAVRRFVHENQGLMRRMYGDVKHISVLRTEINNNNIELDDVEKAAARYSRSGWKKNKYLYAEFQNSRNNDVLTEPHFRPMSTTTTTTKATTAKPTDSIIAETTSADDSDASTGSISSEIKTKEYPNKASEEIKIIIDNSKNSIFDNITFVPLKLTSTSTTSAGEHHNFQLVKAPNLSKTNKSESATISTTLRIFLPAKQSEVPAITPPNDIDESDGGVSSPLSSSSSSPSPILQQQSTNLADNQMEVTVKASDRIDQSTDGEFSSSASDEVTKTTGSINSKDSIIISESNAKQANKNIRPINENMEGQLFQDVAQKNVPVAANPRGVNACPVKEEVVAPFWANNTRGEVLALLNLYPFEQYVHWEKCTNENKQMYCRDGCRCEQQYRLHRLLAYDPHNECRGIFSDWFRFPSCCICKCYDIPLEYRVTSRSPRSMDEKPADPTEEAEEHVRRAIYEHATEDWYRPKDDDDTVDEIELNYFD